MTIDPPAGSVRTLFSRDRIPGVVGPAPPDDRPDLRWARCAGVDVVIKAGSGELRGRLRREAEVIRRCPATQTVSLMELAEGADHTELVTVRFGSMTLAEASLMDPDERGGALRSLCDAVDEMHANGWAHGALEASHVLVGPAGAVRLCSLAEAVPMNREVATASDGDEGHDVERARDPDADELDEEMVPEAVQADRAALATIITAVLQEPATFDSRRSRRRWDRAASRARQALASGGLLSGASTVALLQSAGVPGTAEGPFSHLHRSRIRVPAKLLVAVALAVLVGAAGLALVLTNHSGEHQAGACTRAAASSAVRADIDGDGCPERVAVSGRIVTAGSHRYEVGLTGDQASVGDWDCNGTSTVALLRPATGEVFEFNRWAGDGRPATARLLGTFPGASRLVQPDDSCGPVSVELPDSSVITPVTTSKPTTGNGS